MPSPLTEEDLIALTNKFEKWKDYLNDNNNSSPQDYPSFSPFFNCNPSAKISSRIRSPFYLPKIPIIITIAATTRTMIIIIIMIMKIIL